MFFRNYDDADHGCEQKKAQQKKGLGYVQQGGQPLVRASVGLDPEALRSLQALARPLVRPRAAATAPGECSLTGHPLASSSSRIP